MGFMRHLKLLFPALNISLGDHVLDLCVAPGAKLCMILDLGSSGFVTNIDVVRHHSVACRTMVPKYSLGDRCCLFVADGTLFSLLPIRVFSYSNSGEYPLDEKVNIYKEWTSRRPWKDKKKVATSFTVSLVDTRSRAYILWKEFWSGRSH